MSIFLLKNTKLQGDVLREVALREKKIRKARGLTQKALAAKAAVSLGTLRRFEQTGKIAFDSLVSIAFALDCAQDLDKLFSAPAYASIEDVINDARG